MAATGMRRFVLSPTGADCRARSDCRNGRNARRWRSLARAREPCARWAKIHARFAMPATAALARDKRSEEHTSELQSLMRNSYAVFCLKNNKTEKNTNTT